MNTAVINIKVQPDVKRAAVGLADEFGLSLSAFLNVLIKKAVRTRTITLSVKEEPSEFLIKALKKSREDINKGKISPVFTNADDAIEWLENPKRKYAGKAK